MPSEQYSAQIKMHARVTALEVVVRELIVANAEAHDDPRAAVREYRRLVLEEARTTTFPGVDPATSDLYADELLAALEAIFASVSREMEIEP